VSGQPQRCRGDSGQVGGIEVLPFGFLIFVAGTLLLANVWGVIDAKLATTSAAREATRAFVEGDDVYSATAEAEFRAQESLAAYGRNDERAMISAPSLPNGFTRCGRVTITVSYDVPAIFVPFIGGFGDLAPVESTYSELIDPFRDGLPGSASC
jgi:hypothetical protein